MFGKHGSSHVYVLYFKPLSSLSDLYCTLEVDSFGFFSNKAKTRVYRYTTEPKWNEVGGNTSMMHTHSWNKMSLQYHLAYPESGN